MRIAVLHSSLILLVAYFVYGDAAAPQVLKSQSLIPFPRVGRSRSSFLQSMGSSGGGGGSSEGGGNGKPNMVLANWGNGGQLPVKNNVNKVIQRWNLRNNVDLRSEIKRHLIPFPRVGKRQSLIPFPRVGRSRFFPSDDDEGVQQSAEDSSTSLMNANDASGVNAGRLLSDERTIYIPRWMINSQETEE